MALTNHNLRALFPTHFSRRGETGEAARNWRTLRLPNVRVVGPFWSFVMKAAAMEVADGETPAVQLATLTEVERAVATPKGLDAFHTPTAYRARFDGIWSTNETKFQTTSPDKKNSRISALAVALVDGHKLLLPAPISDTGGFDAALSTEVLLRPLGDLPVQSASNSTARDLTAMQLAAGQIWFRPQEDYLRKLRAILSLEDPGAGPNRDRIALLPDGFALAGRVHLPWAMDAPLDAWFKLTTGPQGTPLPGQLRLWFGPDDTGAMARATQGLLQNFERILAGTASGTGPGWLDLGANRTLRPEDLFWPCQTSDELILQERPGRDHEVHIGSDALVLRLSPDARRSGTSQMVLNPPGFAVSRQGDVAVLTATEGTFRDDAPVTYQFDPGQSDPSLRETLRLADKTELAVPVLDTAVRLAEQTGIRPPGGAQTGFVWLFTPLTNGWLHWPFPFATSANSAAVAAIEDGPGEPSAEAQDSAEANPPETARVVGRFQLANHPGTDGFDRFQREWSVALSDPQAYNVTATLDPDGGGGITRATVTLDQPIIAIDGLLPLTTFRQSDTRLLPERADRALRPAALTAVTERGLSGIEQQARGAVAVTATVRKLSISRQADGRPRTSPDAGLNLATRLEGDTWKVLSANLLPWAWLRHDGIATIQSLPLAVTGAAMDQPSGSRELTPLVASSPRTTLAFAGAFDMARPDVTYRTEARFERPTAALPWQDEIGMIPSTLTSLTLFAGHGSSAAKPVGPTVASRWGGVNLSDAGVQAELRLDVPASDAAYAMMTLPPPPPAPAKDGTAGASPQDKTPEPPFLPPLNFDPQPDNGPGGTGDSSSWLPVFRDRNRSLILATLDHRNWVEAEDTETWTMPNLLGDVNAPVDAPGIDLSLGLEGGTVLTHAGQITVDQTPYPGLPATGDMEGVSASFERPPSNGTAVSGQITRNALDDPMTGASTTPHRDQMGFQAAAASAAAGGVLLTRPLTRHLPGEDNSETVTLVSLQQGWSTPIGQFICHDVPFQGNAARLDAFWRDPETGAWPAQIIDAPGIDSNHLAGFAWALRKDRLPTWLDGHVVVDGLPFEPQALVALERDQTGAGGGTLTRVEISGRIKIALPDRRLLPCGGMVTLSLTPDSAVLDLKGVDIPLADPETTLHPVPRLQIETGTWPCTEATKPSAWLLLDSGGAPFRIKVPMQRTHELLFGPTAPLELGQDPDPGVWMHAFHVRLPWVSDTADTAPSKVEAEAELSGRIGTPGARMTPLLHLDLLSGELFPTGSSFRLIDSLVHLSANSKSPFTGETLALDWTSGATEGFPLFGGLAVTGTRGSVLAMLDTPATRGDSALFYKLRDWGQSVQLDLHGGASVRYDSMDDPDHARLRGSFALDNLMSWPVPDNMSAEQATWPTDPDQRISHHVTLHFDDTRFRVDTDLDRFPLYLPAHASHRLQRPGADPLTWDSYQSVALQPAGAFSRTRGDLLSTEKTLRKAPLSVRALDGRPKADAAQPHLLRSILSYPGGIGRVELIANTGLFIDASGHHWLGDDTMGALLHAPLPVLAVLGDTRQEAGAMALAKIKARFSERLNPVPATPPTLHRPNADWHGTLPALTPQQRARLRDRLQEAGRSADAVSALIGPPADPPRDNRALFQVTTRIDGETPGSQVLQSADIGWTLSTILQAVAAPQTVLSLARHGRVDHQDIQPEFDLLSPDLNIGHYQKAWDALDDVQDALLLPGPVMADATSPSPAPKPARVRAARLRLFAPHRRLGTLSEVATLPLTGGLSEIPPETGETSPEDAEREQALMALLDRWARRVLDGRAWQVPAGLVLYQEQRNGDFHSRARAIVTPSHPRGERPVRPSRSAFAPAHAQPQMRPGLEMTQASPALTAGFTVRGQHPATLLSDDLDLPASGQTEVRLTASGSTREWVLSGAGTRQAAPDPWIVDHETVPFRRFGGDGGKPSHALPPANRAALSHSLAPAASAAQVPAEAERPDDDLSWFIVPARQTQTTISGRAGGWSVARTGIEQLTGNGRLHLSGQMPNWAIHPRPVELGVHDRTRASSHEGRSFDLSTRQSVLLHGKAAPRDALQATGDGGLDRRPRSARAGLITLTYPADGIAPPDWTGRLTLSLRLLGDTWTAFDWTVQTAVLEIGDALYLSYPILKPTEPPMLSPGSPLELRDFTRDGAKEGTTAHDALLSARPGTPATLRLLLADGASGTLSRLVSFRLFGPGAGLAMPDRPLFLRFDDPAYNDQLTDQPKLARESLANRPLVTDGKGSLVMVADRNQVTSGDFLEMGVGLQPASAQDDPPVFRDDVTFGLGFERRRPGTPGAVELKLKGPGGPRLPITAKKNQSFAAFSQMLSLLEPADGSGGPALLPEDRLRVTLFESAGQVADPWATLDFDVVDTPNLPGNSALYQQLHLKPETDPPTLSAPLCPGRSTPTHVEAVDPAEMVSGVLRRRAMFYWYDFTPAPGGQFEGTYAVLKRNLAGAAWLPADLVTEWQKPDTDSPGPGEGPIDDTED